MSAKKNNNAKILVDITRLVNYMWERKLPTGVERVLLAYVEHYLANGICVINIWNKFYVLRHSASKFVFNYILNWNKDNSWLVLLWFYVRLLCGIKLRPDIYGLKLINVGVSDVTGFPAFINKYDLYPIFMLHDLIPFEFSEYTVTKGSDARRDKISNIIILAKIILANSLATANSLKKHATRYNINQPLIKIALLGVDLKFKDIKEKPLVVLAKEHVSRPYFVILSTIEPRKNHLMLLNIWRRLLQKAINKNDIPNLIIIGRRGWKCRNVIDMLDECIVLKGHVFELISCNDLELYSYLKSARALLFPSFAEGYGLPLVEALEVSTPVIVSDIPVFHEIGGDIPEYIDPLDAISWMDMIMEYTKSDSDMRTKQIERMQSYKACTWSEHFKIVDELLGLH